MSFDEKAEKCLSLALIAAEKTGLSTGGGNLRFPSHRAISDSEIEDYCSRWLDRIHPAPGVEVGWRPRLELTDLTVIQMLSKELLQCQGRCETVQALAPIAASLVCGIPPNIAMKCPSSAKFWDWCEKFRLVPKFGERPFSALSVPKEVKKISDEGTTASCVRNYVQVRYSEVLRAQCAAAVEQLEERAFANYFCPSSLPEANFAMDESMAVIARNYDGHFYMHAELENGFKLTTGQLIHYCKQIWHDSELYHLATRWRPGYMPNAKTASKDGEKRGGMYIPDKANNRVSIMGSPSICQGLAPILAAIRIRMDPGIAKKTNLFSQVFFEFMNWDPRRQPPPPRCVCDVPLMGPTGMDGDHRFGHEELMMGRALKILMGTYNESQGQYQGITCFPGVSWSRSDFVANLLLWWPHADIQQGPKFRYVPHFMEKGGLELEESGKYISQQGKASSQGILMVMAASLACGIPAEIAALLRSADQFWAYIKGINGAEAVASNRARIKALRDARFGPSWEQGRAQLETTDKVWSIDQRVDIRSELPQTDKWAANWGVESQTTSFVDAWNKSGGQQNWYDPGKRQFGQKDHAPSLDLGRPELSGQKQSLHKDQGLHESQKWDENRQSLDAWSKSGRQQNWPESEQFGKPELGEKTPNLYKDQGMQQEWDKSKSGTSLLDRLISDFEFSGNVWAEVALNKPLEAWQCVDLLFQFGIAAVGSCVPVWRCLWTGRLVAKMPLAPTIEVHFFSSSDSDMLDTVGMLGGEDGASGILSLLAGLASNLSPGEAINTASLKPWVDFLADKLLAPPLDRAKLQAIFAPTAIAQLRPEPIEFAVPKSVRLQRALQRWPAGTVLRLEWEIEEAFFCDGCWVAKSDLTSSQTSHIRE